MQQFPTVLMAIIFLVIAHPGQRDPYFKRI
jgi:hypothetical protein